MTVRRVTGAGALDPAWDGACSSLFQKREFLAHCEMHNPCGQAYYELHDDGAFRAGAVFYELRMDLLTFLRIPSPVRFSIVGVPCSVSCGGLVGDSVCFSALIEGIRERTQGLLLVLNTDGMQPGDGMAGGKTLPTAVFENGFGSFDEYLNRLTSRYRRRYHRIRAAGTDLAVESVVCGAFTDEMHGLYLDVLKRSSDKLETLTAAFFRNLPPAFILHIFRAGERPAGWCISAGDGDTYSFFLGGIDYRLNGRFGTYYNMLFHMLQCGIDGGYRIIDFGQTAETAKLRTGARLVPRGMLAGHSNGLLNTLLGYGSGLLEYRKSFKAHHVLKEAV